MSKKELEQFNKEMEKMVNSNKCKCISIVEQDKIKRVLDDNK